MKMLKPWMLGIAASAMVMMPLQDASAWDHAGGGYSSQRSGGYSSQRSGGYSSHRGGHYSGHRGNYYGGHRGGHYGGYRGNYYGGYRGYRGDSGGAALVGLAIGTIVGAAIVDASRPTVVVASPPYPPPECYRYYDCDGY
jgi:outer membrane lipoprotein SlyB